MQSCELFSPPESDITAVCVHSGELPSEDPLQGDVAEVAAVPVDRFRSGYCAT